MPGNFSSPSLAALLESGCKVCAVVIPASPILAKNLPAIQQKMQARALRASLPLINTPFHPSIVQMAWEQHIPVWEVHRLADAETVATLATYQPDVICVACFSLRIPGVIRDVARLGCLNVHPSLLPANRGPVPLFWTFREGHEMAGVTIYLIDEGMDSGDILAQEPIEVSDGVNYDQLELQCAARGGALLARTVWDLYEGRSVHQSQDETRSSYHTFPSDEDLVVHADEWSARHVYNFIRGVGYWNGPIELHVGEEMFLVRDCISYSHEVMDQTEKGKFYRRGEELVVCCNTGYCSILTWIEGKEKI